MDLSATPVSPARDFEECLAILLTELELAIRWDRPSLLLAVYPAEGVRQQAEAALMERLRALGQEVNHLLLSPAEYDVAEILGRRADAARSVFFVAGLRGGGGNVYRALNLRREVFVEQKLRVVFWLTPQEAAELPRRAPDFWAFRHRVVEFPLLASAAPAPVIASLEADSPAADAVAMREALLTTLPNAPEAQAMRLSLLIELAALYRRGQAWARAREAGRQAVELAGTLEEPRLAARAWVEVALAALGEGDLPAALDACQQAIALAPDDAAGWESLGTIYAVAGQGEAAIQSWQKSLALDPRRATAWAGLGNAYRAQGRLEEAQRAYRKATRLAPTNAVYWSLLGETLYQAGNAAAALSPLRRAVRLDGKQRRAWETLARAYRQLGRLRAAERASRQVQTLTESAA